MTHDTIRRCIQRELRSLERELDAYPDEASVWALPAGIKNSAGTLVLHLAGNLQHFIGRHLGDTSYVRDRDSEFSKRNVSRAELKRELSAASAAVDAGFGKLRSDTLATEYPERVGGLAFSTGDWLIHLSIHLGYHLGQVDYHRRLVTGSDQTVDTVSVKALGES